MLPISRTLSSFSCRSWRFPTFRGELNLQSSDQLTPSRWNSHQPFIWFSVQDKLSFTPGRNKVFLSNSVNFLWFILKSIRSGLTQVQYLGPKKCALVVISPLFLTEKSQFCLRIIGLKHQTGWKRHRSLSEGVSTKPVGRFFSLLWILMIVFLKVLEFPA